MTTNIIFSKSEIAVARFYIALFGRAPEVEGLHYWSTLINNGATVEQIAQDMFNVEPARNYYPRGMSNSDIIKRFYENVLGRQPDEEGLGYWSKRLDNMMKNGTEAERNLAHGSLIQELITAVVNYRGDNVAGVTSQSLFNNKIEVAQKFVLDMKGSDITHATELISKVQPNSQGTEKALTYLQDLYATAPSFENSTIEIKSLEDQIVSGKINASDADRGDSIAYTVQQQAQHGTVSLKADGSYLYTPTKDYFGVDSFSILAKDNAQNSASQTIKLSITSVNDVPVAKPETYLLANQGTFALPVLLNDTDDSTNAISVVSFTQARLGYVQLVNGKLIYSTPGIIFPVLVDDQSTNTTPPIATKNVDTFTYTIQDQNGEKSAPVTVTLLLNTDSNGPIGRIQIFAVAENEAAGKSIGYLFAPKDSDNKLEGGWEWAILTGNEKGNFQINPFTGELTIAPNAKLDAESLDHYFDLSFSARLHDASAPLSDIFGIYACSIFVLNINEFAPNIAGNEQFNINENTTLVGQFTATDRDVGMPYLSFRLEGADANKFSISPTGELNFLTPPDFESPKSSKGSNSYEVSVIANDGKFDSVPKLISITVLDVLNAPPLEAACNTEIAYIETIGLSTALGYGFLL